MLQVLSVSSLFTTAIPLVSLALLDSWKLGLQIVVKDARSDVRVGDSSDDLSRQFMNKITFRFFWSEALHLWEWGPWWQGVAHGEKEVLE